MFRPSLKSTNWKREKIWVVMFTYDGSSDGIALWVFENFFF